MQIVTENFKRIIKEKGLSQKTVAGKAGIREKQFCEMMSGRRCIRAKELIQICIALDERPNALFQPHETGEAAMEQNSKKVT